MNLLNKELLGVGVAIAVLVIIRQLLPKKKEGFLDASQTGVVTGTVLLLVVISVGIAYTSYHNKY